jgi:hypothetical protein
LPSLRRTGRRWALPPQTHALNGTSLRILGLDPGSQATGYGVIDWSAGQARFVACGTIRTRGDA